MTTPAELDDLLTSIGHLPREPLDLSRWGYHQSDEPYQWEGYRLFVPLSRRGWLLHFDAEGQFFEPGEHTRLIQALLTIAGVAPLPPVRDTFVSGQGWVMEIVDPERPVAFWSSYDFDDPSDYAEISQVTALVDAYADGAFRVVSLATGDQTACLCVMPSDVFEALLQREWLEPCGHSWDPSPDVLRAAWLEDGPPPDVDRLSVEEARKRTSGVDG
jgi:hypothetical protein